MARSTVCRIRAFRIVIAIALVAFLEGSASADQTGFVYALQQVNGGTNQIYGFAFDQTTGALTPLAGFPVPAGGTGTSGSNTEHLAYANGRLFALHNGSDTLTGFIVNGSTGALTAMPYNPIVLGAGNWGCVAVHPSGSPVVVGDNTLNRLSSVVVTDFTADAAAGNPFSTGTADPFSCRFSQAGTHVYTGGLSGNFVAGFSVVAATGVLTALAGSPYDFGMGNPGALAADSSGRLFSAGFSNSQVRAFTTAAGVPTAVTGNPFASGLTFAVHGVQHPGGFYLVADRANRVGVYQIAGAGAATTLTAVAGSPFATGGTLTQALALTSSGAHLIAANGSSRNLTVFQVNQGTGALASMGVQAANTLGNTGVLTGVVFAPRDLGFVYALQQVNGGANQVYGFRINPTGALTALPGFPIATGGTGTFAAAAEHMAYRNGRLYVVNDLSDTLSAFKVNRTTGALTPLAFSPMALAAGITNGCVAVHPSGSPVVVGNGSGTGGIDSFVVGATTATLAPGGPFPTGGSVSFSCVFSQDGSYVYTGGNVGSAIAGLNVDTGTGVLTPLPGSPYASGALSPAAYATDSGGRLFTAALQNLSELRAFTTSAGIPTGVAGNPFAAAGLNQSVHGVLHPNGFYFVAARNSNNVGAFQIAGADAATTLSAVAGSPFASGGSSTTTLALTPGGTHLVAANGGSRNLTVFQVNPASGVLTSLGVQPANTVGGTGRISGMALAPVVPPFIDDGLTALTSVIKAVHITDLRSRIDAVRAQYGFGPYAYTDPSLSVAVTQMRAAHVVDLRTALAEVYLALGIPAPGYTDPVITVSVTAVKLAHILELRAAVLAIE